MRALFRLVRRLLSGLGFIVMLVAALVSGVLWLTLPPRSQQARIPGLTGPVDIGFDADGIPRIRAATELDAAAALGFVHARDRLFQMDLMRRAASGRLSEIAGPATLGYDRTMRTLGLRRRALEDYAGLPQETRAILEAYARGANAWIAAKGRFSAPEFLVLGAPEPWEAADSLLWGETMGLWLSLNYRTELSRQALAGRFPQRVIDDLWPAAPRRGPARRRPRGSARSGGNRPRPGADPAPLPRPLYPARLRFERVGGRRPTHCHGRAPAGRRPAPCLRVSRHLVPGPHRHAPKHAGRGDRPRRAIPGAGA